MFFLHILLIIFITVWMFTNKIITHCTFNSDLFFFSVMTLDFKIKRNYEHWTVVRILWNEAPVPIKSDLSIILKYIWNLSCKIPASQPLQSLIKNSNVILAELRCVYFWQRGCTWTCLACRKFKEKAELWTISTPPINTYIITHGITTILMHTNTPTPLQILPLQSKRGSEAGAESQRWGEEEGGTLQDCKSRNNELGSSKLEVLPSAREHTLCSAQIHYKEGLVWYHRRI